MTSANIAAITFDAGGTLIDPWPSVGSVYAAVAAEHGHPALPAELLDLRFGKAWRARRGFGYSRADWARVVDRTFSGLIDPPPSRTFFPALYDRFGRSEVWRVDPDIWPVLAWGRGCGLRFGVISNWDERLGPLITGGERFKLLDERFVTKRHRPRRFRASVQP